MSAMQGTRAMLLALAVIGTEACSRSVPMVVDSTPPKIVLTALGAAGNSTFASDEALQRKDACAKFRAFPARFVISVGDSGGVGLASIRVANGRIVPESIIVGPDAPESSWEIKRLEGFSELLMIRLARPGAGAVRTGLLGMFNIMSDSQRTSILASAYDTSGNVAKLYEVAVRTDGDAAECR
jgi:hypothetical protein